MFWIKAVYIASIVMSAVVGLPLLRMAFSGEGTSYLAVVFFIQVRQPHDHPSDTDHLLLDHKEQSRGG